MTRAIRSRCKKQSAVVTAGKIASLLLFAIAVSFGPGAAWADSGYYDSGTYTTTESYTSGTGSALPTDNNGGPNNRGYVNKSYHSSEGRHIYKHPSQPSYTSPFDYGSRQRIEPAIIRSAKCNCLTFDATKSFDIDGQRLTVMWDFGDGTTSDQPVVTHCFEKAGAYNVSLTVKDSSGQVCDTGVTSTTVNVSFPFTADAGPEKWACVGENVTFDASGSTNTNAVSYTWDFGDGQTGTGMTTSHAYQNPGRYRVVLTLDDGQGTECSVAMDTTVANISQNAAVTLTGMESACIGRNVSFSAQGTGGKYYWDFGDGTTWEGSSNASHSYQKPGNYTVSVRVDDGRGSTCSTASSSTRIQIGEPPIARISDITSCLVNEPVQFDGSGSQGSNLSYHWNFGDGTTGEGVRASHTYQKAGNYRVILTVKDSAGGDCGMASDSASVLVNTRPEAVIEVR